MKQPIRREAGQTVDELAEQLAAQPENRLSTRREAYPEISARLKNEALSNAIDLQRQLLDAGQHKRVDLRDTNAVKLAAETFMEACARSGTLPTLLAFAPCLGMSRKSVYAFMNRNPDHPTTAYIGCLQSSWAAIMTQMAMNRQVSEILVLFMLKNSSQNLTDRAELEIIPPESPYQDDRTPEEVAMKYVSGMVGYEEPDE